VKYKHKDLLNCLNACLICANICFSETTLQAHLSTCHAKDLLRLKMKTGGCIDTQTVAGLKQAVTHVLHMIDVIVD
jgi:hypothetical protein